MYHNYNNVSIYLIHLLVIISLCLVRWYNQSESSTVGEGVSDHKLGVASKKLRGCFDV